jgi:hypothetical protein
MIQASGDTLRRMLSYLKKNRGVRLNDLVHILPPHYLQVDMSPEGMVLDAIMMLVKWSLVEVYIDNELVSAAKLKKLDRWNLPESTEFFVAPNAVEIEAMLGVRLDSAGQQIFGEPNRYRYQWPEVFVVMPFDKDLTLVYDKHIAKVMGNLGLNVARADNFFTNGSIMADVWTALNHATMIIADCTGRNPNVFYEIGIAHALGKETILVSQSVDDVPFDLRHLRVIEYKYPRGMKEFEAALEKTVKSLSNEMAKTTTTGLSPQRG